MISVDEARGKVLAQAKSRAAVHVPLADALGRVLAEDICSDIDSPPHDKSLVDGYAVIAEDIRAERVELSVLEEVTAGEVPRETVMRGAATRIMTGAPIPTGADAVVMVEQTEAAGSGDVVVIAADPPRAGQNIMRRGASIQAGEVVLRAGRRVRPVECGVLAEIGSTSVPTYPLPSVAILSTGNELVPADTRPAAGQIRNSNGPLLTALVRRAGGCPVDLGIGRDESAELAEAVRRGLQQDVLLLSGGVSAGVLDLVPQVLAELGVRQVFHKVRLKPGKPLWFGTLSGEQGVTLVFGLPGNPVSSLVCFELFVRPALAALAGLQAPELRGRRARLRQEYTHRGDRPTYHPARLHESADACHVEPLAWKGSADLRALAAADCLAYFPPGDRVYPPGEYVDTHLLD